MTGAKLERCMGVLVHNRGGAAFDKPVSWAIMRPLLAIVDSKQ